MHGLSSTSIMVSKDVLVGIELVLPFKNLHLVGMARCYLHQYQCWFGIIVLDTVWIFIMSISLFFYTNRIWVFDGIFLVNAIWVLYHARTFM